MSKLIIPAEVHTDDYVAQAIFDTTKWFEQASPEAIVALAECAWGGDYPSDEVAEWYESRNAEVKGVFLYKNVVGKFKTMGFECYVNGDAALIWLEANRPDVFKRVSELLVNS